MSRTDARDESAADGQEFARRAAQALREAAGPLAAHAGVALGLAPAGGPTEWLVPHAGCPCADGHCDTVPVRHRRRPAATLLSCTRGADEALAPLVRRLADLALQQVERDYEDEDLLKELAASWESLDTLYEVTSELQTSRNPSEVLASILGRIAARRPNLHAVLWIENAGVLEPAAVRRADVRGTRGTHEGLVGRALRDHTTLVLSRGSPLLAGDGVEPELRDAWRVAIAPIATRQRLVGALEVWADAGSPAFDSPAVRLFEALALQAGHVVESDRAHQSTLERERLRSEIAIGGRIQETLLWDRQPPRLQGAQLASFARASHTVDGDFCEFFPHGEHCLDIVIGDVMGKGVPAALIGAAMKSELLRALGQLTVSSIARQRPEPRGVVTAVHEHMTPQLIDLESFVSLSYNRFDFERARLDFVGCGHPRTIHYRARDGSVSLLEGRNLPIGVLETEIYEQDSVAFEAGDLFLFYSDGVTDARNVAGEQFGEAALIGFVQAHGVLDPAAICSSLWKVLEAFTGSEEVSDDLTCVAVRVVSLGAEAPTVCWALEFTSHLDSLPALRAWVRAACLTEGPATPEASSLLELAVTEAASNIIRHAYQGAPGKPIRAIVEADAGCATVTLTHWGTPFRPRAVPTEPPGAAAERGRGLYIMARAVDEVSYYDGAHGSSTVRLVKHIRPTAEGGDAMLATMERRGDVAVVSIRDGVLDASNVKRFRLEIVSALSANTKVVFDLGAVEFIDSSGLGAVLSCFRQLRAAGGDLKLCCLTPPVRALFELVRMHRIFDTYATCDEAVASFGGS